MNTTSKDILIRAQQTLGLTQKDFGTFIGVSARTVNSWMGKAETRSCPMYLAEMALRLAEADARAIEEDTQRSGMFRWALIQDNGFTETLDVFGSLPEAMREAEMSWNHLTDRERKKMRRFLVGDVHVMLTGLPREPFTYFTEESGVIDSDVGEIAADYLRKD